MSKTNIFQTRHYAYKKLIYDAQKKFFAGAKSFTGTAKVIDDETEIKVKITRKVWDAFVDASIEFNNEFCTNAIESGINDPKTMFNHRKEAAATRDLGWIYHQKTLVNSFRGLFAKKEKSK